MIWTKLIRYLKFIILLIPMITVILIDFVASWIDDKCDVIMEVFCRWVEGGRK